VTEVAPQPSPHPSAPPVISLTSISKRFGAVQALSEVSLDISPGEVLGLAGQNGAGKSTLVNVLCGMVVPDDGEVLLQGEPAPLGNPRKMAEAGIAVVSQEQSLVEKLRVWENVYLGTELTDRRSRLLSRQAMRRGTRDLLQRLHVDVSPDAIVGDLPFSTRQLVEIARAIHRTEGSAHPIVVLDEPTSGLSPRETEVLFAFVEAASRDATFLFVSHVLPDVLRLCSRVVVFRNGRLVADRFASELNEREIHELMVGRARSEDYYAQAAQEQTGAGDVVLQLHGAAAQASFAGIDLTLRRGEIVGLAGILGSGTTELAAAVAGAVTLDGGTIEVGGEPRRRWSVRAAIAAGVRYVPPERRRDSLFPYSTVAGNMTIGYLDRLRGRSPILSRSAERSLVRELVGEVDLQPPDPRRLVGELSGGNQQKVVFTRLLKADCTVAVLDNPTRGVDVGTREEIYTMIRGMAQSGTGLVITSESIEELIGLSDRILVLRGGQIATELPTPVGHKPQELDVLELM
jgi:ribose transport system ATP-binding protein